MGTSVVVAHTPKGRSVLEAISEEIEATPSTFEQVAEGNWALYTHEKTDIDRFASFELLKSDGLAAVWKKYLRRPLWRRAGSKVKRTLCKMLRGS